MNSRIGDVAGREYGKLDLRYLERTALQRDKFPSAAARRKAYNARTLSAPKIAPITPPSRDF